MIHATTLVVFYAVIAAASVLALTATLVVLRSDRPRADGIAFLGGFLAGSSIACVLGLGLGDAAVQQFDSYQTLEAALALLLGLALIAHGLRARHTTSPTEIHDRRGSAIRARLSRVGPVPAFALATLLGFGGPKRLVLTFLAMTSVSEASLSDVEQLVLVLLYVAIATAAVSLPVATVVLVGPRGRDVLDRGEHWIASHATVLRVWVSIGIGAALVIDGIARLVA